MDLHKLGEWATMWRTKFSAGKFKLGCCGPSFKDRLMRPEFAETERRKDLGVIDDTSVKVSTQRAAVVKKKANSVLGIIQKGMENETANIVMPLWVYGTSSFGILCPVFIAVSQKRHLKGGERTEEGNQDDLGVRAPSL